jgi:hypothetical protein
LAQLNADTVAAQLEVVKKDIPVAYERDDTFFAMVDKRTDQEDVGSRGLFQPIQVRPGGRARQVSLDGGDLGLGSASQYIRSTVTPIDLAFAIEVTKKTEISTNMSQKAVANIINRETASGMKQFRTFLDILSMGAGSGILGTISAINGLVLTISGNQGTAWFYTNQGVEMYTSTLATKRTGTAIVTAIDPKAVTITVDALPTGTSVNDVVVIEGLAAGAGLAQTLYGLAYQISSANTGTSQGLNRALYPEIRSEEVAAGNVALTLNHGRQLLNKIAKRLGIDFAKGTGCKWWWPLEQKYAYEELAQAVMEIEKHSGASDDFDGSFEIGGMQGIKAIPGIHADPTAIYLVNFKTWCRAVSAPIDYYVVSGGGGQTRFPRYGASGGIAAATIWYLITSFQFLVSQPRGNGLISGLAIPTGVSF